MAKFNYGDNMIISTVNEGVVRLVGPVVTYREGKNPLVVFGYTKDTEQRFAENGTLNVGRIRQEELKEIHRQLTQSRVINPQECIGWVSGEREPTFNKYSPVQ